MPEQAFEIWNQANYVTLQRSIKSDLSADKIDVKQIPISVLTQFGHNNSLNFDFEGQECLSGILASKLQGLSSGSVWCGVNKVVSMRLPDCVEAQLWARCHHKEKALAASLPV